MYWRFPSRVWEKTHIDSRGIQLWSSHEPSEQDQARRRELTGNQNTDDLPELSDQEFRAWLEKLGIDPEGTPMTEADVERIRQYLKDNPDDAVNRELLEDFLLTSRPHKEGN